MDILPALVFLIVSFLPQSAHNKPIRLVVPSAPSETATLVKKDGVWTFTASSMPQARTFVVEAEKITETMSGLEPSLINMNEMFLLKGFDGQKAKQLKCKTKGEKPIQITRGANTFSLKQESGTYKAALAGIVIEW